MKFKKYGYKTIVKSPRLLINAKSISIGRNTLIEENATLYVINNYSNVKYNGRILIGEFCYINHSFNITCAQSVIIEDNVTIAYNVSIFDNIHGINPQIGSFNKQPLVVKDKVIIGSGSWIGANCFIMASIGKNCIIGANAVVTKPIPDYCIAAGNPARVIKKYDFTRNEWIKV